MFIKSKIKENYDPKKWSEHYFGMTNKQLTFLANGCYIVTGAGTGFGRAIAFGLASMGAKVILSSRDMEKLNKTKEFIKDSGINTDKIITLPINLLSHKDINDYVNTLKNYTSRLSGTIHCAGVSNACGNGLFSYDSDWEDWEQIIGVNSRAIWYLTKKTFQFYQNNGYGRVVMFSSEAGWAGGCNVGLYNVSKSAVNSICQTMSAEYQQLFPNVGMQINVLVPGEAKSEMNKEGKDSPFTAVNMTLLLLAQDENGPNGYFFHRDGRHYSFGSTKQYPVPLK